MAKIATVFMFSGQGSQYYQMGKALFDNDSVFRESMLTLDGLVRELTSQSVIEALYAPQNSKGTPFNSTLLTHPAIFMVEYSLAQSLIRAGVIPDIVLGTSMGSFAAAAVAGSVAAESALMAVVRQAQMLERWCEPGAMLAILGKAELFNEAFLSTHAELAAVNFDSHFVVSLPQPVVALVEAELKARGVNYQPLPVSFAFHSQWIDAARAPYEQCLRSLRLGSSALPFVCCHDVAMLSRLAENYFWEAIRRPIRFQETIASLNSQSTCRFVDVGPAGTLATFLKYGLSSDSRATIHSILTPYGRDLQNYASVTKLAA